ncbi:hypothetical protein MTO96_008138 [Rhipicephalus appendiculatus]
MGRPLVVRTPEEEAALAQRRREIARERARRRRLDPTLRAADAAAHRQRRAEQPEVREREAQCKRQRRAENPDLRQREAQAKRQRRATDPDFRERDVRAKRQRRANECPSLRQRRLLLESSPNTSATSSLDTDDDRNGEENDPSEDDNSCGGGDPLVKCAPATNRSRRLESSRVSCAVCDRLCSVDQVATLTAVRPDAHKALRVLSERYPGVDHESLKVCSRCTDSLIRGVLPAFGTAVGTANGYESKMPPTAPLRHRLSHSGQKLVKSCCWSSRTAVRLVRDASCCPGQCLSLLPSRFSSMSEIRPPCSWPPTAQPCQQRQCLQKLQPHGGATLQQSVVGSGGMLLEQPASAEATHHQGPPVLQQRHVLANGQPPPDPDSIPVLEPITAEEHFHAEMLHQTIKQTALLQDMLSAQQRMAEAAERQAQAAEEQSHALSQLALFLIENHRSNRNSGANLSSSVADDCSCPEAATPLSITPEILQVEHST